MANHSFSFHSEQSRSILGLHQLDQMAQKAQQPYPFMTNDALQMADGSFLIDESNPTSHRGRLLFAGISAVILIGAAIGYGFNITNGNTPSLSGQANHTIASKNMAQSSSEAFTMLDLLQPENTSVDPMSDVSEVAMPTVEMASIANDPFEPILTSDGAQASNQEEEAPEIYFSGMVDDPVHKKKIIILKVRNADAGTDPDAPAFITIVKKLGEQFTVGDRTMKIQSIKGNQLNLIVNGEPLTLGLDSFNTAEPDASGASLGALPSSGATDNNTADKKVNSIQPAESSSTSSKNKAILKLDE